MFFRMLESGIFLRLRSFFDMLSNVAENKKLLLVNEDGIRQILSIVVLNSNNKMDIYPVL